MKKIKILAMTLLGSLLFMSCNDWMDLYPENAQTPDQFWETKDDVEAVVGAGYVKLRSCTDYMFVWGEARGFGINIYSGADDNAAAAYKLRRLDILPSNIYAKWGSFYQVINMANTVLRYAPQVLEKDPSFTEAEMNSYFSEAYFQRALAYFYLVRTFKDVPFIENPYVEDEGMYDVAKSDEEVVLAKIIEDLKKALPAAKEYYPEINDEIPLNTKGRATKWAIYSLLADIYLWQGNYTECIDACDKVIKSGRVGLISKQNWFTNFYPGNSNESVFEIQYSYDRKQTNDFIKWFNTTQRYEVSRVASSLFFETEMLGDVRGLGGSYTASSKAWKYLGLYVDATATGARSTGTQNDQNYIIYRLADIYLMKAEALIMTADFTGATKIIGDIRARAGIEEVLAERSSEETMLDLLMQERSRELVCEGKCWFDMLRIARRNDYQYKDYMIEWVLSVLPTSLRGIAQSKLSDVNSHYLPIHKDEINSNKLLEQNPYYRSLGN